MTQLTWDKQHHTHETCGSNSLITQTGRTVLLKAEYVLERNGSSFQNELAHTIVFIPHSMLVFSYINLLTTGHVTKFKVSF